MTKTILLLLVEDEPRILMDAEEALIDGGFEVITALNGTDAECRLVEHPNGFAGVITDIRLEGKITGWEIARRAREANPSTAIVYMTADSAAEWASKGVPNSQLVQKPFANAQLVTAISMLLTQNDSTPQD